MTKERRLGRGLEALLGRPVESYGAEPAAAVIADAPRAGLPQINVFDIDKSPYQPRRDFDQGQLVDLAESLRTHGLLQPVVVRKVGDRYQLVAGERRLKAAIHAGWSSVPAQILEVDDRQAAELAIVENLQRKDLNPLEKAVSFQQYLERYGCTQEDLANRLRIDRSTLANLIRLLELPEPVQSSVREGRISQGHARALLPLGDEREQVSICLRIEVESLSVRATEALVHELIQKADQEPLSVFPSGDAKNKPARGRTRQVAALEQELRSALGAKVDVRTGAKGSGKIVLHFHNHEEFERLHRYLCEREAQAQTRAS